MNKNSLLHAAKLTSQQLHSHQDGRTNQCLDIIVQKQI